MGSQTSGLQKGSLAGPNQYYFGWFFTRTSCFAIYQLHRPWGSHSMGFRCPTQ